MKTKNYLLVGLMCLTGLSFAQTGTTYTVSITSGGSARSYTYYVPTVYTTNTNTPVPLIINVHGFTGTSAQQEAAEDFRPIADTANFIILHPQALGSIPSWDVWNTVASGAADRAYIMQCVDSIEAHYKIDTNRVYITGYSQGGYMSYNLSTNYSNRITAMASVCGTMSSEYYNSCYPLHPLPVMEIHGDNDQVVSYTNGQNNSTSIETMVGHWVQFNHCNTTPAVNTILPDISDSATVDQSKVVHYVFTGGCKGVTVEFYKVLNGGHMIPSAENPPSPQYGVGNQNRDFTAAKEIWRFFRQYKLSDLYNVATPETVCTALANPAPTPAPIPPPHFVATGVDNLTPSETNIAVYPNPSNGTFTLSIGDYQNVSVKIVNLLGEVVYEKEIEKPNTTIHIDAPAGIYLYQVKNSSQLLNNGKIIIK